MTRKISKCQYKTHSLNKLFIAIVCGNRAIHNRIGVRIRKQFCAVTCFPSSLNGLQASNRSCRLSGLCWKCFSSVIFQGPGIIFFKSLYSNCRQNSHVQKLQKQRSRKISSLGTDCAQSVSLTKGEEGETNDTIIEREKKDDQIQKPEVNSR